MMNPNILNQNPLMFFDRAVNAQRSQLLTVMAAAVSECRTAADQAAELNETGQVGLLRLAEVWSAIRAKDVYKRQGNYRSSDPRYRARCRSRYLGRYQSLGGLRK